MRGTLLYSLLELAHATSQNLGFVHRADVNVSYGEETITETNLLELRRRHPAIIHLRTFGKKQEALNGADWEWHIIGRARKLRMRVQAKRLQKNNKLKIPHQVGSSGNQQIELLIEDAKLFQLKPVYCFYASEVQRTLWRKASSSGKLDEFEYGCLLASAHRVKAKMPKSLTEIEADCIPWHYLFDRQRYFEQKLIKNVSDDPALSLTAAARARPGIQVSDDSVVFPREFPTIDELNAVNGPKMTDEGLVEVGSPGYDHQMEDGAYLERGINRLVELDVRKIAPRRRAGS